MPDDDALEAPGTAPSAMADDERLLWARWRQENDPGARDALLARHLPYARTVAAVLYSRRFGDEVEFDDYHQWAVQGLLEATDRYDPERGAAFRTYAAHWMKGRVLDGANSATEKHRQLEARRRLREDRLKDVRAVAEERTRDRSGPSALFGYLAEVGIGVAVGVLLEGTAMVQSDDQDSMPSDPAYLSVEMRQLGHRLHACIGRLSQQEQNVIRSHYLNDQLFDEIAQRLELSKGRISQIHRQALQRLRLLLDDRTACDLRL